MELSSRQSAFLELARSLLRLERSFEGVIDDALRSKLHLTLRESFVLGALDRGQTRPGEVAEALNLAPPSVTRLVERLVERDAITRTPSVTDRRQIDLVLTDEGRRLVHEARRTLSQALADAWPELSTERASDLAEGLARLAPTPGVPTHDRESR
ncbi:MAG: MarR family transcriptional regulator [Trueperaceae bacterium]